MKKVLYLLMVVVLISSCQKKKGCTNPDSFNYDSEAELDDGSCNEMYGCLGYVSNMSNSGSTGITLNNQYYDIIMNQEVAIQKIFFNGIPANVFILYEQSASQKNAYANVDGYILFGYHMFYYTVSQYGELPVAGILAHEFGHRVQFTAGWNAYKENAHMELEADAFSGFYMALAKQWAWSQIQNYYANVYATGDYYFNSPVHHGSPQQRLEAAYLGVQTGISALQNGTQYTYQQLHDLFIKEIENNIDNTKKSVTFEELKYPENLKKEYIESLFPKF